jgi:NAD(P)-dependent dehydrogenase (short-subunit alcohol dehydrogenase family)
MNAPQALTSTPILFLFSLQHGDTAIATARNPSKLSFADAGATEANFLALALDVTSFESIEAAFTKAVDKFGRIDVV